MHALEELAERLPGARQVLRQVGRREFVVMAVPLLTVLAVWGFIEVARVATSDTTHQLDEEILLLLRSDGSGTDPIGPEWLEEMARDVTALGSVALLSTMLAIGVGFVLLNGKYRTAAFMFISVSGGMMLSFALKSSFDRPRPGLVAHEVQTFTSSFPSAHSMAAAVTFLTLGALLARTQTSRVVQIYLMSVATALTLTIGISRVYLGVHWPTDVLGGWIAGGAWALLCGTIAAALQVRGSMEQAG